MAEAAESLAPAAPPSAPPAAITSAAPPVAPPPAAAPAAPPPSDVPEWLKGASEDIVGVAKMKGWKSPVDAVQAYQNAQKLIGVPENELLRLPNEKTDKAGLDAFYNKLGRPTDPSGYEIPLPQGQTESKTAEWAKGKFHELGLSGAQGAKLGAAFNEHIAALQVEQQTAYQNQIAQESEALKKEWGAAYDAKLLAGKKAVETFGITREKIDAMEKLAGFSELMRLMANIGGKLGEDTFVTADSKNSSFNTMTPAEAKARITALRQDPEWVKGYLAKNVDKVAEMQRLQRFANP